MYVTIRRNSPCTFCSTSAGPGKRCTVVVGQKTIGEKPVRVPICPACVEGVHHFLGVFVTRRAIRRSAKLAKLIRGGSGK